MVLSVKDMARDLYQRTELTAREVSEITGIPTQTVYDLAGRAYKGPERPWTSGCHLMVAIYLEEGFPLHTVAELLNRREHDLEVECEAQGIPVPEPWLRWAVVTKGRGILVRAFQREEDAERYRRKTTRASQFKVTRL